MPLHLCCSWQDGEEGEAGPRQGIRVVLPARETPASSTGGKTELSKATALAEQRLGGPAPDGAKKRMGRDGREDTKGRRSLKGQQVGSVEPDDVESKGGNFTGGEEVADRNAGSKQPPAAVLDKPQVGSGASRGPKSPKDEDEPRASHQKAPGTRKLEGEEATEGDAGDTNAATRPILNVGDLVEANRGSKGEFHPGKVRKEGLQPLPRVRLPRVTGLAGHPLPQPTFPVHRWEAASGM